MENRNITKKGIKYKQKMFWADFKPRTTAKIRTTT
jgi:hypothetical protein